MYPASRAPMPSPDAALAAASAIDSRSLAARGGSVGVHAVRLERDDGAVAEPQGAVRGQLARDIGRPGVDGCEQPASLSEEAPPCVVHVSGELDLPQLLVEPPQQLVGRIARTGEPAPSSSHAPGPPSSGAGHRTPLR